MSDLPSINDLLSQGGGKKMSSPQKASLDITPDATEEKFDKKMVEIAAQEQERETFRFAEEVGMPHIDLKKFPISQEALRQMPVDQVKKLEAVCFYATQDEIRVGALDPKRQEIDDLVFQLEERNHAHGAKYVISKRSLDRVIKLYETLPTIKAITKDVTIKSEDLDRVSSDVSNFDSLQGLIAKASTTDLLITILGAAFKLGASDIHVEAEEEQIALRFRLDGVLHDAANLEKEVFRKLTSRIKLNSSLKINVTDKPQDGRFTIKLPKGDVDVRVSTMPSVYGESIVMRLLKQSREGLSLDSLGIQGDAYEKLQTEIGRPNGMIITTGPTGSGKTTTLYSVMHILNQPDVKIITLEDPVEYRMEGVIQSQIDRTHEYTFGKGLRSILRQDPDIAMVGEIRDLETADIAIQAALTGHLMLSTIHTNSAAGAIPRFLSMGVKPFLLAPALNCVIGQRLTRRLCQDCKKPLTLPPDVQKQVEEIIAGMPEKEKGEVSAKERVFYGPGGCEKCHGLGYKGRVGIYEIFVMNPEIEQMILGGQVSEYEIEKVAVGNGMVTMVQDGLIKALEGLTSLEEVFRVIE